MTQQVDFLKSIPKNKTQLPADMIIAGIAVSILLLILASIGMGFYQSTVTQQLLLVQEANQKETAAFQALAQAYPLLASDTPLVTKVLELEKKLQDKEAYFTELTHTTVRKPFSKYLIAISQAVPEGLWLTSININQDSGNMSLEGNALSPWLVSDFLKKLETIPPFVGETFDLFAVKKHANQSGVHQFEIANNELLNETLTKEKDKSKKSDRQDAIQSQGDRAQTTNHPTVDQADDDNQ